MKSMNYSPNRWNRAHAVAEDWGPWFISATAALGSFIWLSYNKLPSTTDALLNATIGLSAIAIGFLATAKSMLFSLSDNSVVRTLKESGHHDKLLDYFMSAIRWAFILAVISTGALVRDYDSETDSPRVIASIWVLSFVQTGGCSYRIIYLFARVIRLASREGRKA